MDKPEEKFSISLLMFILLTAIFLFSQCLLGFYMYNIVQKNLGYEVVNKVGEDICAYKFQWLLDEVQTQNPHLLFKDGISRLRFRRSSGIKFLGPVFPGLRTPRAGSPGPPGPPGAPGSPGVAGPKGPPGSSGIIGKKGPAGLPGFPGVRGSKGDRGPTGVPGENGTDGIRGTPGKDGQQGSPGKPGIKGDRGSIGSLGRNGGNGNPGPKGPPGEIGLPGLKGECCRKNLYLNDQKIEIKTYGTYSNWKFTKPHRLISAIGKGDNYGVTDNSHNSWLADSNKVWVTSQDNSELIEFDDVEKLQNNVPSRSYKLPSNVDGNSNVIYNGLFYYKDLLSKSKIIEFDFKTGKTRSLNIKELQSENVLTLYSKNINHFDFSVDENGLWVIFGIPNSMRTGVAKIDEKALKIQNMWDINVVHKNCIDMFVASGILYTVEFNQFKHVVLGKAINLCSGSTTTLNLEGINTSDGIDMVAYDHNESKLRTLDNGKRVSYPIIW